MAACSRNSQKHISDIHSCQQSSGHQGAACLSTVHLTCRLSRKGAALRWSSACTAWQLLPALAAASLAAASANDSPALEGAAVGPASHCWEPSQSGHHSRQAGSEIINTTTAETAAASGFCGSFVAVWSETCRLPCAVHHQVQLAQGKAVSSMLFTRVCAPFPEPLHRFQALSLPATSCLASSQQGLA